jgi:uncharacterized protein with HEPN domain
MSLDEIDRLRPMRDAAAAAMAFAAGKGRADLEADQMFQFAIVRALEIIGEAAARLPDARGPSRDPLGQHHRDAEPTGPWLF